jgi:hypothetical protein
MLRPIAEIWEETLDQFPPWSGEPEPNFFRDFLGARTRTSYLPPNYASFAGTVQGRPGIDRAGIAHDAFEWAGVLRAVAEAKGSFTCIELGAGWGPFLVGAAKAAQRLESLIKRFVERLSQVFMLQVFHVRTSC